MPTQVLPTTSAVQIAGQPVEPPTPAGLPGPAGLSAYQIAVLNGFVGTEAQWLASLAASSNTLTLPASGEISALRIVSLLGGAVALTNPASASSLARMIGIAASAAADGMPVTVRQAGTMTDAVATFMRAGSTISEGSAFLTKRLNFGFMAFSDEMFGELMT